MAHRATRAEQCEGCTHYTTQVGELSYLHSRGVTYATFCQGPYEESIRYRDFMGWEMPWYSAQDSLDALLIGRRVGKMHLVCYLRDGDRVFETYWTTVRGVEAMDYSYGLLDLTVYGRQETWEDSPAGWPTVPRDVLSTHQRASHRPVVAPGSRTLRRPRHHPALTRIIAGIAIAIGGLLLVSIECWDLCHGRPTSDAGAA